MDRSDGAEENRPLIEDIRLLGRLLGDVVRENEGKAVFDTVEEIRQLSVAVRLEKDAKAGRKLDSLLSSLSDDTARSATSRSWRTSRKTGTARGGVKPTSWRASLMRPRSRPR